MEACLIRLKSILHSFSLAEFIDRLTSVIVFTASFGDALIHTRQHGSALIGSPYILMAWKDNSIGNHFNYLLSGPAVF